MNQTHNTATFSTVATRFLAMALAAFMSLGTLGAINGIAQYEAAGVGTQATVELAAKAGAPRA